MFISSNGHGSPGEDFSPQQYVWLRDHRSAVSAPRGNEQKETDKKEDKLQTKFFVNLFK